MSMHCAGKYYQALFFKGTKSSPVLCKHVWKKNWRMVSEKSVRRHNFILGPGRTYYSIGVFNGKGKPSGPAWSSRSYWKAGKQPTPQPAYCPPKKSTKKPKKLVKKGWQPDPIVPKVLRWLRKEESYFDVWGTSYMTGHKVIMGKNAYYAECIKSKSKKSWYILWKKGWTIVSHKVGKDRKQLVKLVPGKEYCIVARYKKASMEYDWDLYSMA